MKEVSEQIAEDLGLSKEEFGRIKELLGRVPNFTELSVFSAMWSEHCSYKNSKKMLELLPKQGSQVLVKAGEENSGVVDIGDGLGVAFKIESHNHPSAVEPFEAAATGIGGCLRDIFTMGARPLAGLASLRFGELESKKAKWLLKEVIRGLAHYGNAVGIPSLGGEIHFDKTYDTNPLVNAFVLGIVQHKNIKRGRASGAGNLVYYLGGQTGRDGVGGAAFASQEIDEAAESKKSAVAIGDPEMGKKLAQACLEIVEKGCVIGIQDMGAAGLTCSCCETASRAGSGIEIDLALIPQREENMLPFEILLSESQERMLVILDKQKEKDALEILQKWQVPAVKIGKVTTDGIMRVKDKGEVVCEVPARALTEQAPVYEREEKEPTYLNQVRQFKTDEISEPVDYNDILLRLLASSSIASKEWAYEQYEPDKQQRVIIPAGSDAGVIKVEGTNKAVAATVNCQGRYCYLNPFAGAMIAVAESARKLICVGARLLGVTDGLNFGNPMKPENYWVFHKCIQGISSACKQLALPVVSGNVSFYNENPKGAIDPTPIIGMVGVIDNIQNVMFQYFTNQGDCIILLGISKEELGGSEYLKQIYNLKSGDAPCLDLELEKAVQATTLEAINNGLINSAQSCSEGGLAVALVKCCISNKQKSIGAVIDNLSFSARNDTILFGESQSRIVLSCSQESAEQIKNIAQKNKTPFQIIGRTGGKELKILREKKGLINLPLEQLSEKWREDFKRQMEVL